MSGGTNLKTWVVISVFVLGMCFTAAAGRTIYVDNVGSADFSTIQAAINDSNDGDMIIVQPGLYLEFVKFGGKNITLRSTNPANSDVVAATIISSVGFLGTEDQNCTLSGFKINAIYGAEYDIDPRGKNHNNATISHCLFSCNVTYNATVISGCDGTISNCVVVDNKPGGHLIAPAIIGCHGLVKNCTVVNNFVTGIMVLGGGTTTIENCIIYGNIVRLDNGATLNILYSDVEGGLDGIYREGDRTVNWGPGNIDADPCFVRVGDPFVAFDGDYHLKSQAGRWDPNEGRWTRDEVTSPCIDAGDPTSPIGLEPFPNGGIINMGAYGGTTEASKSYFGEPVCETIVAGDINGDCKVNFIDFAILANNWLRTSFVENIFDFAVATKGALNLQGNIDIGGASIFIDASVYIESLNNPNALDIIGNSHIAGDVFIINPDAIVTLQGGQASIGGETGQDAIDNHVNFGVPSTEFPVPEPNYFRHYVQNTYDPNNVLTEYDNVIITAGTNPLFGDVTLRGVAFIEAPNIVRFGGNTEITGIIVGNGDLNDNSGTNQIIFAGAVTSYPVTDLPDETQFEQLRNETGTFLMAPGFKAVFFGNFDTLNGAIAANGIEFGGNAGGTIDGSIINYSDEPMTISGNSDLFFNRSGTAQMPAGFD